MARAVSRLFIVVIALESVPDVLHLDTLCFALAVVFIKPIVVELPVTGDVTHEQA